MGVSTDGQICFGIPFEEGFEFPWDDEQFEDDIEAWWRSINGYVNPMFDPFDETGNYKPGISRDDPRVGEYFKYGREWDESHPLPVEVVNYCSGDCPYYMLAVKSSFKSNSRGYPEAFEPAELIVSDAEKESLLTFLRTHGIEHDDEPKWYLTSCWG